MTDQQHEAASVKRYECAGRLVECTNGQIVFYDTLAAAIAERERLKEELRIVREGELTKLREQVDRLQQFGRKQRDEIENLTHLADAVECLRDIGKATGCNHVDDPDGRRQLVNCVEQEFTKLVEQVARSHATINAMAETCAKDKKEIERLKEQRDAAEITRERQATASSLSSEATTNWLEGILDEQNAAIRKLAEAVA